MRPISYPLVLLLVLLTSVANAVLITQEGSTTSITSLESQVSFSNSYAPASLIACTAAFKNITVNGSSNDWSNIPVSIDDPGGDVLSNVPDIAELKLANNKLHSHNPKVFFAEKFANAFPALSYTYLLLDTDENYDTGCPVFGIGAEYGITIGKNTQYIGDARDCSWSDDFPDGGLKVVFAKDKKFIEGSIPIATLRILTPLMGSFDIAIADDQSLVGCFFMEPPPEEPCLSPSCIIPY